MTRKRLQARLAVMPITSQVNYSLLTPSRQALLIFERRRVTHVPVGEDQQQHLELTRDPADISNIVVLSDASFIAPFKRIPSLRDPTAKMSNSSIDPNSRILLRLVRNHRRAGPQRGDRLHTFDPAERPETSNTLTVLSARTGEVPAVTRGTIR